MAKVMTSHLEAIQFTDDGTLLIRVQKRTKHDGEITKEEWHRTAIPPGVSVDQQMAAVNAHLQAMGFSPVVENEIEIIRQVVKSIKVKKLD